MPVGKQKVPWDKFRKGEPFMGIVLEGWDSNEVLRPDHTKKLREKVKEMFESGQIKFVRKST